jgi:putative addiction module component (TIGR02574 family)
MMRLMSDKVDEILKQAMSLSEQERGDIAGALLESLEPPADAGVERAWRDEVARRLAQLEAGGTSTVPWEEVRDQLYARLRPKQG